MGEDMRQLWQFDVPTACSCDIGALARGPFIWTLRHGQVPRSLISTLTVLVVWSGCAVSAWAQSDFASAFAVGGTTVGNVTTFGAVSQYQGGTNTYVRLDTIGRNRWGDYSATTLDPANPATFWTTQEWASGPNQWSTEIAHVSVGAGNTLNVLSQFQGSTFNNSGFIPPDTMGAVGPSKFVELLNGTYAVYNKTTGALAQPRSLSTSFGRMQA
jgi:hypothetical protein